MYDCSSVRSLHHVCLAVYFYMCVSAYERALFSIMRACLLVLNVGDLKER